MERRILRPSALPPSSRNEVAGTSISIDPDARSYTLHRIIPTREVLQRSAFRGARRLIEWLTARPASS